ncbi:MAG: cadmium-translocating P-type ATPase [Victivallales bacterium]|nr:cadmium-translocating P-type ATPase [Victivallales bacterium]
MCHHHENQAECCGHNAPLPNRPLSVSNRRTVYFDGPVAGCRAALAQVVQAAAPSAELEWDGNALTIIVPEDAAPRLPVALRELSKWLRAHAPEVRRSYTAPIALDEEDDEAGEDGFSARHRNLMLVIGAVVFVAALAMSPWLPESLSIILYVIAYLIVGKEVILNFFTRLSRREFLDETFLMTIASLGAFAIGECPEAVAVMLFYQVGEAFQRHAVGRSRQSIAAMMDLRPDTACLQTDGGEAMVAPEEVAVGEVIAVRPGERIPLDGVVTEGHTLLDTSALTGESLPQEANPGDEVLSGSICQTGRILVKVTRVFGESTLSRILEMVQHAGSLKTPTERFITVFSRYYTPAVVIGALLLGILPPLLGGGDWSAWIHRALVFLVVSCPCALVISVPLSYFGGIGAASRQNVLVKGSACIDALANVSTVVFDKTGTLTRGTFQVQEIAPAPGFSREELLNHAAHVEYASSHPIAKALRRAVPEPLDARRVTDLEEFAGHGVKAKLDGRTILAGNYRFLRENRIEEVSSRADGTVVHVAVEGRYAGAITIADQLKPDSQMAVQALRREGVENIQMFTGDHRAVAEETAAMLGLDGFHAELLPGQKVELVEELELHKPAGTKVAFVGDGINDAPVLARADLGIAMGGIGSDAAVAAADAVLMTDRPSQVAIAIRIARKTLAIVRQNIAFALGVKALILALGALGCASLWLAVFGDVGVAVLATLNATRALHTGE